MNREYLNTVRILYPTGDLNIASDTDYEDREFSDAFSVDSLPKDAAKSAIRELQKAEGKIEPFNIKSTVAAASIINDCTGQKEVALYLSDSASILMTPHPNRAIFTRLDEKTNDE